MKAGTQHDSGGRDIARACRARRGAHLLCAAFDGVGCRFLNFQETFPDDGDVNMIQAMRVYKEVGYDGMIMPDHVPKIEGDAGGRQTFAFAFGYIQAPIQMVRQEA